MSRNQKAVDCLDALINDLATMSERLEEVKIEIETPEEDRAAKAGQQAARLLEKLDTEMRVARALLAYDADERP